tara:strand:- start:6132 stop:6434 length:303 start_codon:yes stop_codon:yes gene_type:complete
MVEYVRLSTSEQSQGEKGLLVSQLQLITMIKHLKKFKKIRKEELTLKVKLKSKIGETLSKMKSLNKALPKSPNLEKESPESQSLENELSIIKQKLNKLQE